MKNKIVIDGKVTAINADGEEFHLTNITGPSLGWEAGKHNYDFSCKMVDFKFKKPLPKNFIWKLRYGRFWRIKLFLYKLIRRIK